MSLGLTESELWVRAGWTMIHYLWVGTLLGLGAVACKWALKSAVPHVRYLAALAWLATLAISPIAIAVWVGPAKTAVEEQRPSEAFVLVASDDATTGVLPGSSVQDSQARGSGSVAATLPWGRVVAVLPWIWLFGSPVVLAWSLAGLAGAERLRRLSSPTGDPKLEGLCRRLARSLKVSREISVRLSTGIASPVLAGILRPVILLPPALLSGLAPEQVEMLLLHELAHVRRWDNLVNFVQRTTESLLFFHPVVWLVSRWVRREREHCCDAMVLERAGDGVLYAETLLAVAQKGLSAKRLGVPGIVLVGSAVSPAVPGNLRSRIDRILRREDETMRVSRTLGALMPVVLFALVVLAGFLGIPTGGAELAQEADSAVAPQAAEESAETDAETETKDAAPPEDRPAQSEPRPQEAKPAPQGKVRWVNERNRAVWVNLGREEGVKRGTKLHVYGPGKKDAPVTEKKGVLVITRILGDHLAEARIEEESTSNPIIPGDRVRSPGAKRQTAKPGLDMIVVGTVGTDGMSASVGQEMNAMRTELQKVQQERDVLFQQVVKLTEELHKLTTERKKLQEETKAAEKRGIPDEDSRRFVPMDYDNDGNLDLYFDDGSDVLYRSKGDGTFAKLRRAGGDGIVLADSENDQVEISIGSDDGLSTGRQLEVYRREGAAGKYVGRIEVLLTQPDRSICRVLSDFLQRPIRKGDRVATELLRIGAAPHSESVDIDAHGQIRIAGKPVTLEELCKILSAAASQHAHVHLSVAAHPKVGHQRVVDLITECQQAGVEKFSFRVYPGTRDEGPPAAPER